VLAIVFNLENEVGSLIWTEFICSSTDCQKLQWTKNNRTGIPG